MDDINNSESAQMYLVTMAQLAEGTGEYPIPVARVAEILGITPISANQMIHTLEQAGLVTYTPYKGVAFTESGSRFANQILRTRRLWEVFLVAHLGYDPQDAETLACRLEHAIPPETADRLAEFLGNPLVSPQGKPIPGAGAASPDLVGIPLTSLPAGARGKVIALPLDSAEQAFVRQAGLQLDARFEVIATQENGACLLRCETGLLNLAVELAQKIRVQREA